MKRNLDAALFKGAGRVVKKQLGQISLLGRAIARGQSRAITLWAMAQQGLLRVEQHDCSAQEGRELLAVIGRELNRLAPAGVVVVKARKGRDEAAPAGVASPDKTGEQVLASFAKIFAMLQALDKS